MRIILFAISLLYAATSVSQKKMPDFETNLSVQGFANIRKLDATNTNNNLLDKRYQKISQGYVASYYGFKIEVDSIPFFAAFRFGTGNTEKNSSLSYLSGTHSSLEFYYSLVNTPKWFIGPALGFNYSKYELQALSKSITSPLTEVALLENVSITNSYEMLFGVGGSRKFTGLPYVDLALDIESGYIFSLGSPSFLNFEDQDISSLSHLDFDSLYLNLGLSIWLKK